MERNRALATAVLLLTTMMASACYTRAPAEPTGTGDGAIADTALTLTRQFHSAWAELDPEQILAFVSEDVQYDWMGTRMESRSAFEEALREYILPSVRSYSAEMINPHVEVLGASAAVASYEFHGSSVKADGEERELEGAVTYVFERRAAGWRIVHMHESGP